MTKRSRPRWRSSVARGVVLRGELLRLRRRGDRVWIRFRPFEIVWRTTNSFAVDDIQLIEIQPVTQERRRRRVVMGRARTRMSEAVLTRLTLQDAHQEVAIELNETPAAIAEVFADLQDRLAVTGGWHDRRSVGSRLPRAGEESGPTGATRAAERQTRTDLQEELFRWCDSGDRAASDPVGDDLFSEEPPKTQRGRHDVDDSPGTARSPSRSSRDLLLFPFEEPSIPTGQGFWIRKRTTRIRRLFG